MQRQRTLKLLLKSLVKYLTLMQMNTNLMLIIAQTLTFFILSEITKILIRTQIHAIFGNRLLNICCLSIEKSRGKQLYINLLILMTYVD